MRNERGKFSRKDGTEILDQKGEKAQKGSVIGVLDDDGKVHYFMFVDGPKAQDPKVQADGKTQQLGKGATAYTKFAIPVTQIEEKKFQKLADDTSPKMVVRICNYENTELFERELKKEKTGHALAGNSLPILSVLVSKKPKNGFKGYLILPYLGKTSYYVLKECKEKYIADLKTIAPKGKKEVSQNIVTKDLTDLRQIFQLILAVIHALKNFHNKGYAHGDPHNTNITFLRQGNNFIAHLIDFQLMRKLPGNLTTYADKKSTPEQNTAENEEKLARRLSHDNRFLSYHILNISGLFDLIPSIQQISSLLLKIDNIKKENKNLEDCGLLHYAPSFPDGTVAIELIIEHCSAAIDEINEKLQGKEVDEAQGLLFPIIEEISVPTVEKAFSHGYSIKEYTTKEYVISSLVKYVIEGNLPQLRQLHNLLPEISLDSESKEGVSLIEWAAIHGQIDVLNWLLKQGVSTQRKRGRTYLDYLTCPCMRLADNKQYLQIYDLCEKFPGLKELLSTTLVMKPSVLSVIAEHFINAAAVNDIEEMMFLLKLFPEISLLSDDEGNHLLNQAALVGSENYLQCLARYYVQCLVRGEMDELPSIIKFPGFSLDKKSECGKTVKKYLENAVIHLTQRGKTQQLEELKKFFSQARRYPYRLFRERSFECVSIDHRSSKFNRPSN